MDALKAVETYLKTDRTLLGGRNLYNKLPGKSLAVQNTMARFTNNQANLDKLHYELAKTAGIPDRKRIILLQKPLVKTIQTEEIQKDVVVLTNNDRLMAFETETAVYKDAKKLASALGLKPVSQKKLDVFSALTDAREDLVKKK